MWSNAGVKMRGILRVFLVLFMLPAMCLAGVGDVDNRFEVTNEMWEQSPYNKFVHLKAYFYNMPPENTNASLIGVGNCTGQYVSPNLILSAGHCKKDNDYVTYRVLNYKYKDVSGLVELIHTAYIHDQEYDKPGDWAVWLIKDPKYYNKDYFNTLVPSEDLDVINAGWGAIRVLKDDEIQQLKSFLQKEGEKIQTADLYGKLADELKSLNLPDLEDGDQLKASECKVFYNKSNPDILKTNCDSWAGNSGGGYVQDNTLYGICSYGANTFDDASNTDYMVSAKQFKAKLQELITKHWPKDQAVNPELSYNTQFNDNLQELINSTSPEQAANSGLEHRSYTVLFTSAMDTNREQGTGAIGQSQESDSGDSEDAKYLQAAEQIQEDLTERQKELLKQVKQGVLAVQGMDYRQVLVLLNKIVELNTISQNLKKLEDAYQQAKERETSLANRTLTAMTMAATGIGGMQLAQGLAEQKADKDAEMAMDAYMATFRCEYGGGKSFKGGATQIELPGGNNSEMMKLRQSYFKLAADLKERKNILGLKAGIESLVVLDKVQTGLYDDEGVGVTSGAYGSLYRAKMGSEADQAKLDEAGQVSAGRVKGGGAALGTGAVGGVSGDLLINHMQKK